MTREKLQDILTQHQLWLNNESGERADLRGADLRGADLRDADLRDADLQDADLCRANLFRANLSGTNLSDADLSDADLRDANLSDAKGLISAADYLARTFERTEEGYVAYKTFNATYRAPGDWVIAPGQVISENVNSNRCQSCGCGINVAPLLWVRDNYNTDTHQVWKVLIRWEWLAGVCVPYMTDGKVRCERVELLEVVE